MMGRRTRTWENSHQRAVWENGRELGGLRKGLISCPHTNAERMSLCDKAASLLAAGMRTQLDDGAGVKRRGKWVEEWAEGQQGTRSVGIRQVFQACERELALRK